MRNVVGQRIIFAFCMVFAFIVGVATHANTISFSFYEGVDLDVGIIERDPTTLVIEAGAGELPSNITDRGQRFEFGPEIDVSIGLNSSEKDPFTILPVPNARVGLFKETSFGNVTPESVAELKLTELQDNLPVGSTDTIVVMTANYVMYKIGNISRESAFGVTFDYEKIVFGANPTPENPSAVPEGSTFALFGIGLLVIFIVIKWKCSIQRKFFCPFGMFIGLVLLSLSVSLPICAFEIGEGAPDDTVKENFEKAYSMNLGTPVEQVEEGFVAFNGAKGYWQRFTDGGIVCPAPGMESYIQLPTFSEGFIPNLVQQPPCAVIYPKAMFEKWESLGLDAENPIGYPVWSPAQPAVYRWTSTYETEARVQEFQGGLLIFHESGEHCDDIYEIHGAIYDKWKSEERWGEEPKEESALGFPVSDEQDTPGGKMSEFEEGYIFWKEGAAEAYETHGLIAYIYQNEEGGTGSWMGFPITDEEIWYNGWSINMFEYGYITSLDGIHYYAFTYYHDNKLDLYDFWKKPDPIYANISPNRAWWLNVKNFYGQYKVRNIGTHGAILIDRLALTVLDSSGEWIVKELGGERWNDQDAQDIILKPGDSHSFDLAEEIFPWPGSLILTARAQIRGVWYELGRMNFEILGENSDPLGAFYGYRSSIRYEADPVNTLTGHYIYQKKDLALSGKGIPFVFARTYNSPDVTETDNSLGAGWTHTYNMSITLDDEQNAHVRWGDGRHEIYRLTDECAYEPVYGGYNTLENTADGTFVLTTPEQLVYHFNLANRLESITDRSGNTVHLDYTEDLLTRIVDTAGREFHLSYDADEHLINVTDPLGRNLNYTYDAAGDLVSATDAEGNTTKYAYDDQHQMTSIRDARGNTLVESVYDEQGRVICQQNAKSNPTAFTYDEANQTSVVTDMMGNPITQVYNAQGQLIEERDATGNSILYQYDEDWNRTSITDKNENTTNYAYDQQGNIIAVTDASGATTHFTFDERNNMLSQTDASGNMTAFDYDDNGNMIRKTDPLGNAADVTYTATGQPLTITDPKGNVTAFTYDSDGNLAEITDALGNITTYEYDGAGRPVQVTDALGRSTTFVYDENDRLVTMTDPLGNSSDYTYDANGNTLSVTDLNGQTTTFTYDVTDLMTATTDPTGKVRTFSYDKLNRLVATTSPDGSASKSEYDHVGNLIEQTDPSGRTTTFTYDANGNRLTSTNALGETTTLTYDAVNRLTSVTDPNGNATTQEYDALGQVISTTNANGQTTRFQYDAMGRLTLVTDAQEGTVHYTYDANGNRLSMQEPNGNITTFAYDELDRLITKTEPSGSQSHYTYDAVGNLVQFVDPNGNTMHYTYDDVNRLLAIHYPDGTSVQFAYDANGNTISMKDALGTSGYQYDQMNRLTEYTDAFGMTVGYQYNENGKLKSLVYPDGKIVTYTYDAANRLTGVTDWLGRTTTYTYDLAGRLTYSTNPNGTSAAYTYDSAGRLIGLTNATADGTILCQYEYTLDALGNHLQVNADEPLLPHFNTETVDYVYDEENRLIQAGNMALTFDNNGNLLTMGADTFAYDFRNRLIQSTIDGIITSYQYDGTGNRLAKIEDGMVTRYTLDVSDSLSDVLTETDKSGVITAYYVYGLGLIAQILPDTTTAYYHYDFRGSTIALTDGDGVVTDQYAYTPFGKLANNLGTTPNPFKYVGKSGIMDENEGLYYMRARYYSGEIGRFLNKDLLEGHDKNSESLNRYTYVLNNPVSLIDPNGLSSVLPFLINVGTTVAIYCQRNPDICGSIAIGTIETIWMLIDEDFEGSGMPPENEVDLAFMVVQDDIAYRREEPEYSPMPVRGLIKEESGEYIYDGERAIQRLYEIEYPELLDNDPLNDPAEIECTWCTQEYRLSRNLYDSRNRDFSRFAPLSGSK